MKCPWVVLAVLLLLLSHPLLAQNSNEGTTAQSSAGGQARIETQLDKPGLFHKEFGMPRGSKLAKSLRPLSKVDLDADLDYDGVISNEGSGGREDIPPGLELGKGELTKIVIRFKTYENDFPGELYVKLSVRGINRFAETGEFSSVEQQKHATGRIKVWDTADRGNLLLDSDDPEKQFVEWKVDKSKLARGVTGGLPRTVYVEGIEVSNQFEGDLRIMVSSSHTLSDGEPRQSSSVYRTAFDHILFTVREQPLEKGFVNNNAEGVWPAANAPR